MSYCEDYIDPFDRSLNQEGECEECGHGVGVDPRGRCLAAQRDPGGSLVYCGCYCDTQTGFQDAKCEQL